MKNRLIVLTFSLFIALTGGAALAQTSRELPVGDFQKLSLQGELRVEVTQGERNSLRVSGRQDALDELTVSTTGNELTIKTKLFDQLFEKNGSRDRSRMVRVELTYVGELDRLLVGRGAEVRFGSVINGNALHVEALSGGTLDLGVVLNYLKMSVQQGAIVTVRGKAVSQESVVNTGAELRAQALESEQVTVRANTGGLAKVNATRRIEANANTGGVVNYQGRPKQRVVDTSLGGEVNEN